MKTVYLPDEDVLKMKTTWRKLYFSIAVNPSMEEVEDAKRRQELRSKLKSH